MTESFKQQLQDLINQAAEKFDERNNQETDYYCPYSLKQGCDLLIPVLMKAVEQRNRGRLYPRAYEENKNEELLQLLKGER